MHLLARPIDPDLRERLGERFLAFICSVSPAAMAERVTGRTMLHEAAEKVLGQALPLATQLLDSRGLMQHGPAEVLESPSDALARLCSFVDDLGMGLASAWRLEAGGEPVSLPEGDPVLRAILTMARDYFPALLLPRGERNPFDTMPFPITLAAVNYKHPANEEMLAALTNEEPLRSLFAPDSVDSTSAGRQFMTRSGRGSATNAGFLATTFLMNGEHQAWRAGSLDLGSYLDAVADEVKAARLLCEGREATVRATVGLGPLQLDENVRIKTPWGLLRPPNPWETRWAPSPADAILEADFPMAAVFWDPTDATTPPAEPRFFEAARSLETEIDLLRFALAIGVDRDRPISLAPVWQLIPDPLQLPGFRTGFASATMASNKLSLDDEPQLQSWMALVDQHADPSLELPIRRVLSALTSRVQPEDGLVDAMIALESLFGTGQGEVSFRLSVALAWLLGTDPDARDAQQRKVGELYGLRSRVVHGKRLSSQEAAEAHASALNLVTSAFKALFSERPDLLGDPNRGRVLAVRGARSA